VQPSFKFAVVVTLVLLSVAMYLLCGTTSLSNAPNLGKDQLRPSDLLAHNHAAKTAGILEAYVEARLTCKMVYSMSGGPARCRLAHKSFQYLRGCFDGRLTLFMG